MSNAFPTARNLGQYSPWTLKAEDANIDGMAQGNIANEILRQIGSVAEKIDDVEGRLNEKIERVEDRVSDKVDQISHQLGGPDGVRERLTALEIRFEHAIENTPATSYPPPGKIKKKSAVKEHAPVVAGTAGAMTLVYTVAQIISAVLQQKP